MAFLRVPFAEVTEPRRAAEESDASTPVKGPHASSEVEYPLDVQHKVCQRKIHAPRGSVQCKGLSVGCGRLCGES